MTQIKMNFKGEGVYDFSKGQIENPGDFGYRIDGDRRYLAMHCPKFGVCLIEIHKAEQDESKPIWKWDGNVYLPSIWPSIGCDKEPRCGSHRSIIFGVIHDK